MKNIDEALIHFGFSEQEAEIYQSVLVLGVASVTEIAKKAGKQRTATYFHIKNLLEKGILKQIRDGRKLKFSAIKPAELALQFDHWTTDFKSVVPQLEALKKIDQETPVMEVTESKKGYFKIYDEISALPVGSTFRVAEGKEALVDELTLLTNEQWKTFFTRIVDRKIITKGIFTEESLNEPNARLSGENKKLLGARIWNIHTFPEITLPLQKLAFIYGDKVAFLFPESSLVMTIQHKGIAELFTAMFDALFEFGKSQEVVWK